MPIGTIVKDPQGIDLEFDINIPCVSGTGEHYTAERDGTSSDIYDVPLYYTVGSGEVAAGSRWKLYCWKFCPFSSEWSQHHKTIEATTGTEISLDGYYTYTDPITRERTQYRIDSSMQTTHAGTKGRMAYHQRGRKAGFICVDPDCYYYATYTSGTKYFFQI